MGARAPFVAALFAVTSTGAASGQATGLPVYHRWIFDGTAFALDLGFDAGDQSKGQISVSAFTAGLARKPFAFTATLAHNNDTADGISGGISAGIVARPNEWAALGAAQVDAGFSAFGGVRRIRVPVSVAIPDRKSTRLNSSHVRISYAVFCLKKKRTQTSGRPV